MKIVFFMESYYCGGVDTLVINLINNWPNDIDELKLICNKDHAGIESIQSRIKRSCEFVLNKHQPFTGIFINKNTKSSFDRMKRMVLKVFSPILRYLYLAHNIFALRKIIMQNDPDRMLIVNGGYPGGDSCRAAAICWGLFSRKALSIHSYHGIATKATLPVMLQERIVDYLLAKLTKIFITDTQATAKTMSSRKVISRFCKIINIYPGVELMEENGKATNLRNELNIPQDRLMCLMLGNYTFHKNYDKGHKFLFRAFKKVVKNIPRAYLLICGDGSCEEIKRVHRFVLEMNLENNIHLSGFRKDIPSLLKQSDLLLLPAQAFECFGIVCVEAMASHIPVVATRVGGIPEVVVDGQGGYCVEKEDVDTYADRMIKFLEDEAFRKEQGEKGFQRYKTHFTADHMAKEYARLICET